MRPVIISRYVKGKNAFEFIQPGFLAQGYARLIARYLPNPIYLILQKIHPTTLSTYLDYE